MGLFGILKALLNPAREKKRKSFKKVKIRRPRKKATKVSKKSISQRKRKTYKYPRGYQKKRKVKQLEIGIITHYFNKISVGVIKLKAPLRLGDKIHIKGLHDDFTQIVTSMQLNHKDISYASRGKEVGIKVIQRVHENDKVYRVSE